MPDEKKDMSVDDIIKDTMKKMEEITYAKEPKKATDETKVFENALLNKSPVEKAENTLQTKVNDTNKDDAKTDELTDIVLDNTDTTLIDDDVVLDEVDVSVLIDADAEDYDDPKKQRWSKKKKFSVVLCYLIGAVLLICGSGISAFAYYTGLLNRDRGFIIQRDAGQNSLSNKDTIDVLSEEEKLKSQLEASAKNIISDKDVTNILLVGQDIRDKQEQSRGNTDVMMLISINSKTKKVTMTSFMRDMYLSIPNFYPDRINSAYAKGDIDLLEETIEQNFAINIDRYVLVDFASFIDIVDAVGGVEIQISTKQAKAMWEPMGEQNNLLGKKFTADFLQKGGTYNMNGNQALGYARIRYIDSDFNRTARQRKVMEKIAEKASDLSLLELKDLLDKILPDVTTDLTDSEIAYYLLNASEILGYPRQQFRVPADDTWQYAYARGMSIISTDLSTNINLLQQKIYGYSTINSTPTTSDKYITTTYANAY